MLRQFLKFGSDKSDDRRIQSDSEIESILIQVKQTKRIFEAFYKKITSLSCEDDEKKKRKAPLWPVKQEMDSCSKLCDATVFSTLLPQVVSVLDMEVGQYCNYLRRVDELLVNRCQEVVVECKRLSKEGVNVKHLYTELISKRTEFGNQNSNADPNEAPTPTLLNKQREIDELESQWSSSRDLLLANLYRFQAGDKERCSIQVDYLKMLREYHEAVFHEMAEQVNKIENEIEKLVQKTAYGVELNVHLQDTNSEIAYILQVCTDALLNPQHVREQGLFRISPNKIKGDSLVARLNIMPKDTQFLQDYDANTIAHALKNYLGRLPQTLINKHDTWQSATELPEGPKRIAAIKKCVDEMQKTYRANLAYLCHFLRRIADFEFLNRMNTYNLAVVFAPNVIGMYMETQWPITVLKILIEDSLAIFPAGTDDWLKPYSLSDDAEKTNSSKELIDDPSPLLNALVTTPTQFTKATNLTHSFSSITTASRPAQNRQMDFRRNSTRKSRAPPPPVLTENVEIPKTNATIIVEVSQATSPKPQPRTHKSSTVNHHGNPFSDAMDLPDASSPPPLPPFPTTVPAAPFPPPLPPPPPPTTTATINENAIGLTSITEKPAVPPKPQHLTKKEG